MKNVFAVKINILLAQTPLFEPYQL